jgi:alkaline phosphatase
LALAIAASGGEPAIAGTVKNVILMISDGQGFNAVQATDYYTGHQAVYESFDVKLGVQTSSASNPAGYSPAGMASSFNYAKNGATDSSAAATAMYSGQKVYDLGINWSTSGQALTNFFQNAAQTGKSIGAVTSVEVSHATPAAVYGHNNYRNNYADIAKEAVYGSNPIAANGFYDAGNYNGNLKVVMGAGHPKYNDNGIYQPSVTDDYVGGTQAWTDLTHGVNGWTLVDTTAGIRGLASGATPDKVIGVAPVGQTLQAYRSPSRPANSKVAPYADPQTPGVPKLVDLTKAALNVLDNGSQGFAVMIEGGAIDWANHSNLVGRMIEEETDFNNSVQTVVDYLNAGTNGNDWSNTLLIVTADHETGHLWGDGRVAGSTFFDVNGNGTYDFGVDYAHVKDNGAGVLPDTWYFHGNHTNALVPLFAMGAGSELFADYVIGVEGNLRNLYNLDSSWSGQYVDNTSIFEVMTKATGPDYHPVPEPSALVLCSGLGGLGLAAWMRRKRTGQSVSNR